MIWRALLSILLGLLTGVAAALFLVFGPMEIGGIQNGAWRTNANIGASDAGPLLRAVVARRGLLALNRSETVYFTAWEDDQGRALDATCRYAVSGQDMPTRWWSLTLYADDDFLPRNGDAAYALTRTDLGEGAWNIIAGPERFGTTPWLSTRNAGAFSITLRLYHPEDVVREDPESLDLPSIQLLDCGADT
ncbi:DUF1214 domain-containing protein [Maricaulis parjimensis]|uniref:DUF1214 domain-containing protein n=1 Tax=Maricaulis parjimensis TaxID=144023 RepID=UPI0019392D66|nr:DUF1214 domain-containing protein [Maricaulis parjimensis]